MSKRTTLTCCVLSLSAGLAFAQPFSATLAFEASTDGGQSWQGGLVELEPGPRTVQVRIRADWTPEAGYAFARCQFDIIIENAGTADDASDFLRPVPFTGLPQSIMAMRFGSIIKIDDSRDTLPPGMGLRGVHPTQVAENFNPDFDASRPVTVFYMSVLLDGTPGARLVTAMIPPHPGTFVPSAMLYTTSSGMERVVPASPVPLTLNVIPAPGSLLLAPALLALSRRRRNFP